MKKSIISLIITILSVFTAGYVSADEAPLLTTVDLTFTMRASEGTANSTGSVSLFDGNKTYYADVQIISGSPLATAHFDVDPFAPGKDFKFNVISGFQTVKYYDNYFEKGREIELWTYTDAITSQPVTTFNFYAMPEAMKPIQYFRDYEPYALTLAPVYLDGLLYVPAGEGAKSLGVGIESYDAATGAIVYKIYDKTIELTVGRCDYYLFGEKKYLEGIVANVNGYPYIPLISFAKAVDAKTVIQDEGTHINAVVSRSKLVKREGEHIEKIKYVNSADLESETDYLIWVSKNDFKVRLYKGSKNNWDFVKEYTCAIGKDSTPTCTGTYKYYSKEKQWSYSSYYVGPIMRFNGGYAIHSTLIKYNGVPYDNRVGMKLSHGCVRLQPQDINDLIGIVPLQTTIHITNS